MRLRTPPDWYRRDRRRGASAWLVSPLAWAWTAVTASRIARARPLDPGAPVICVGNLTVGGVGKTPIVRELASRLRGRGAEAQVLMRGHGGRLVGPVRVDPAAHGAGEVGDEALMLAADFPVWVARDRAAGARAAVAAGASVIVMDDGHQNPSVAKALSIVVVDGETRDGEWPFGDGAVVPAGPMREPLAVGLARADAVILLVPDDLPAADPELLALFGGAPVLIARLTPAALPPPGPQLAFAGIGKPWKMERALKAAGCDLVDFAPLADHEVPSERLLGFLADRAQALGAGLVASEKDWVRLSPAWRARVVAWPVRARFEDEAAVDALLAKIA
ncbi:MAG: tetraacyldisaccharide 4'-kinase [Caulobacteraceae bacterium]